MDISQALKIKGYMSVPELVWLARTASKSKCIVEIGTFYGRSARAMADNTNGKIYCIDPYPGPLMNTYNRISISSGEYVYKQAQHNLKDHIESGKLIFHRGTVKDFPHKIEPDFIFIDGDHLEEPFRTDLVWALTTIAEGGILAGHDYENVDWPAVKKLVDNLFSTVGRIGFIWYVNQTRFELGKSE